METQQQVNILVVEDDAETANALGLVLKNLGFQPWLVDSPQEGLNALKQGSFPAVITELRSPKMNGAQFAREANKISSGINVLVLTPYSVISSAIEAMEAGAYGYITKPLNNTEVRIVVEHAVERFFLLSAREDNDFLVNLAVRDGLTGLFNRRYFNELITIEVNRLRRSPALLSLLMLDIDNFKNYNDTKGHPAGDDLLKQVAKILKSSVRSIDMVCRYGGEEFIIILPQTDKTAAKIIAERVRVQIELYLPTTVSIGISTYPEDASEIEPLIKKADNALYQAKQSGKNKWCVC